jgi:hypothetical protein
LKNTDSTKNEEQFIERREENSIDDEHERKKSDGKEKSIT